MNSVPDDASDPTRIRDYQRNVCRRARDARSSVDVGLQLSPDSTYFPDPAGEFRIPERYFLSPNSERHRAFMRRWAIRRH